MRANASGLFAMARLAFTAAAMAVFGRSMANPTSATGRVGRNLGALFFEFRQPIMNQIIHLVPRQAFLNHRNTIMTISRACTATAGAPSFDNLVAQPAKFMMGDFPQ
jgi:hypothetical protein